MTLHLTPNWAQPVRETYSFKTNIFTSESGKEQRTATRLLPRRSISFEGWVHGQAMRSLQGDLINRTAAPLTIPDPAREAAVLSQDAPVGGTIIRFANAPAWLAAAPALAISSWDRSEFRNQTTPSLVGLQVALGGGAYSVDYDGNAFDVNRRATVTLSQPLSMAWPAGSEVRPAVSGRLTNEIKVDYPNSEVVRFSAEFGVLPGAAAPILPSPAVTILGGYPLLDRAPNWAGPMSAAFASQIETVDYDRGVIAAYLPVKFHTMVTQMDYLGRSHETIGYLLNLFIACRGRQKEFYCPTWRNDLQPLSGIEPAGTTLYVDLDAQQYRESTVLRTVRIALNDGRVFYRQISAMQAVNNQGIGAYSQAYDTAFAGGAVGDATRLTLDNPIFAGVVQRRDIESISWTPRCRFATDALTVEWLSDGVARCTAQIMTLEQL